MIGWALSGAHQIHKWIRNELWRGDHGSISDDGRWSIVVLTASCTRLPANTRWLNFWADSRERVREVFKVIRHKAASPQCALPSNARYLGHTRVAQTKRRLDPLSRFCSATCLPSRETSQRAVDLSMWCVVTTVSDNQRSNHAGEISSPTVRHIWSLPSPVSWRSIQCSRKHVQLLKKP